MWKNRSALSTLVTTIALSFTTIAVSAQGDLIGAVDNIRKRPAT